MWLMNILELAIKAEGSVNALALAIGVRQNVISNWRARESIPAGWEQLLKLKYELAEKAAA